MGVVDAVQVDGVDKSGIDVKMERLCGEIVLLVFRPEAFQVPQPGGKVSCYDHGSCVICRSAAWCLELLDSGDAH